MGEFEGIAFGKPQALASDLNFSRSIKRRQHWMLLFLFIALWQLLSAKFVHAIL
jgi:nitrate reductase NapE component